MPFNKRFPQQKRKNSPWLRYAILASVLLLLWLAVRNISLKDTLSALSQVGGVNILLLLGANGIIILTMTARWWWFLVVQGYKIPYTSLMGFRLAGNAVSYFTPGPQFGGEPVQVYLLHRIQYAGLSRVPVEVAAASVAMDRLMEMVANFTVLSLGSVVLVHVYAVDTFFRDSAWFFVSFLLGIPVLTLWAVCSGKRPFQRLLTLIKKPYAAGSKSISPRWGNMAHTIRATEIQVETLCQEKPAILFQAGLFSLLNWSCVLGEFWLTYRFLGVTLGAIQLLVVMTAARFAFLTPLPGGIGALEASQVMILNVLGVNPAIGLSACIIIRIRDLIVGCLGLWLASIFTASVRREVIRNNEQS